MANSEKTNRYYVRKPIIYRKPGHKLEGQVIQPDNKAALAGLPMDHLTQQDIDLLVRKGYLTAAPPDAKA